MLCHYTKWMILHFVEWLFLFLFCYAPRLLFFLYTFHIFQYNSGILGHKQIVFICKEFVVQHYLLAHSNKLHPDNTHTHTLAKLMTARRQKIDWVFGCFGPMINDSNHAINNKHPKSTQPSFPLKGTAEIPSIHCTASKVEFFFSSGRPLWPGSWKNGSFFIWFPKWTASIKQ